MMVMAVIMTQDLDRQKASSAAANSEPEDKNGDARTLDELLSRRMQGMREIVDVDEPTLELVVFELAGALFALPGSGIEEILADASVFWVPGTPASFEGVLNIRGNIESVITLNDLLQLPTSVPTQARCRRILLAQGEVMRSGIRVDGVLDVTRLPLSCLSPAPETLPDHLRPYVTHLAEYGDRPLTVLNLERLFADYAAGLG